jgi:pyrroline-5-carboxylate reductase
MRSPVGIIGLGAIGAMLARASRAFDPEPPPLWVATRRAEAAEALARELPGVTAASVSEVAAAARLVFVCVPPGAYLQVVDELAGCLAVDRILVCVTNGVALPEVERRVACPVIKLIPTMAHAVGRGVSLLVRGARSGPAEAEAVAAFVRPFGQVLEVTPGDLRGATNIAGCGPALFACFCAALAASSEARIRGLDAGKIEALVAETFAATGALLDRGARYPGIMQDVAMGGGMTQAALSVLGAELPGLLERAACAIAERERQLKGD